LSGADDGCDSGDGFYAGEWALSDLTPALGWREQIEVRAAEAQREIHAMGNSARRSIGQVLRRAREAERAKVAKAEYSSGKFIFSLPLNQWIVVNRLVLNRMQGPGYE